MFALAHGKALDTTWPIPSAPIAKAELIRRNLHWEMNPATFSCDEQVTLLTSGFVEPGFQVRLSETFLRLNGTPLIHFTRLQ